MKQNQGSEFFYQLIALLIAVIVVHSAYVTWIRPNADTLLQQQAEREAAGEPYVAERSLYIVVKDFEQEACFILMLWAMAIMARKAVQAIGERQLLDMPLLRVRDGTSILPDDTIEFSRPIEALPQDQQDMLIPRALKAALTRFHATHNVADAGNAVSEICNTEGDRLDSELAMVRYIVWAIPSIGFIGTVRGIGEALSQAHKAVAGDISGVTASLGVAFNSTFVALVISILIMFLSHQLQLLQERQVLDAQRYCDDRLLRYLRPA